MGIHGVSTHPHGVLHCRILWILSALVLGHDEIGHHPPTLSNIEIVRPMVVFNKLVFWKTPTGILLSHSFRNTGMILQTPNQAQLPLPMPVGKDLTLLMRQCCPVPVIQMIRSQRTIIHAYKIRRDPADIVGVGFTVRHRGEFEKVALLARRNRPKKNLIIFLLVVLGLGNFYPVSRNIRQTHPIAKCLQSMIRRPYFRLIELVHPRKQPARSIARNPIGIDPAP